MLVLILHTKKWKMEIDSQILYMYCTGALNVSVTHLAATQHVSPCSIFSGRDQTENKCACAEKYCVIDYIIITELTSHYGYI